MNSYDIMYNSLMKNIQELSEFLVDEFGLTGYYDLVDFMIDLHNFKVGVYKENKELALKILKELEREEQ